MALVQTQPQQIRADLNTAPVITRPLPAGAFTAQASGAPDLSPLVNAVMKAKLQQKLGGRLPGTTPQSIGAGTAGADAATGPQAQPLSLGGPPQVNA